MPSTALVVRGEVLPPENPAIRMPPGTPLGLGILGAARFNAIRRVIEQYERALRAKESAILAEAAVANAMARREVAREQLRNLDLLRDEESERIRHVAAMGGLRRELERMELEDQIAERTARRANLRKSSDRLLLTATSGGSDDFSAFIDNLRKMPDVVNAVAAAKDQIIKQAGGDENLSEAQQQACELFDAMLHSFISKKAGEAAL